MLSLSDLGGVITDSHFTERSSYVECKEISAKLHDMCNVGRFGRLLVLCWLDAGRDHRTEQATAFALCRRDGLAVDASTAMVINPDGTVQVYGSLGTFTSLMAPTKCPSFALRWGLPQATLTMTNVYMTWAATEQRRVPIQYLMAKLAQTSRTTACLASKTASSR